MLRLLYISLVLSQFIGLLICPNGVLAKETSPDRDIKKEINSEQVKPSTVGPVLAVSPKEINLGLIGPGEGIRGNFVLKNAGSGIVNWTVNGPEGWTFFDAKKLSGILEKGTQNMSVHVSFLKNTLTDNGGSNLVQLSIEADNRINIYRKQLSIGSHREMLKLPSNGGTRTIYVRFELATGHHEPQIDVNPARIDFGSVGQGESVKKRFQVTNTGREVLKWRVAVQASTANGTANVSGKYISFVNEDIKGSGVYAAPNHLKGTLDIAGKWPESSGFPLSYVPSNVMKYHFWGTGIAIFCSSEKDEGDISAFVDEVYSIDPDCRNEQKAKAECLIAEGLPYGSHILTIINKGGSVIIEGVRIYGREMKKGLPGWISVFPLSGTTTKEIDYVNVNINTKNLESGYYGENIIFNSNGGKVIAEVSVEVSAGIAPRIIDVYRFVSGYDYLYTANPQAEPSLLNTKGYKKQGIAYRLFSSGTPGTTPFHRWYNAARKDHFYSSDTHGEGKSLKGYVYEGAVGNIATSRLTNTRELYRWYNPSTGCHFYSTDLNESIIKKGYRFDGIAGYVR
ncbi:MAG TPA: hypothetical protein VMT12_12995 [Syntrophales bacterium]|nr:hypothetical protein [Syntrophales bacterium]